MGEQCALQAREHSLRGRERWTRASEDTTLATASNSAGDSVSGYGLGYVPVSVGIGGAIE